MSRSTPDPMGHDDDVLTQSETLDEDDMGVDPLEGGMDPADGWSASNRYGTTAIEQATDRPLTERLEEERPDFSTESVPDRPAGESATRRSGYLVTEPDQPAADETAYIREE